MFPARYTRPSASRRPGHTEPDGWPRDPAVTGTTGQRPAVAVSGTTPTRREACVSGRQMPIVGPCGESGRCCSTSAQDHGLTGVLVRTGKYRPETLSSAPGVPDHVIDSVADLPRLVDCASQP